MKLPKIELKSNNYICTAKIQEAHEHLVEHSKNKILKILTKLKY